MPGLRGRRYYGPNGRRRTFYDPTFHQWLFFRTFYKRTFGDTPHPWVDFDVFLEDMGERPEGYCIRWEPGAATYNKDNVWWGPTRWHKKTPLTVNNETRTIFEWSQRIGLPHRVILLFKEQGYDPAEVIAALLQLERQS